MTGRQKADARDVHGDTRTRMKSTKLRLMKRQTTEQMAMKLELAEGCVLTSKAMSNRISIVILLEPQT
jgi:hypothetical protein